MPARSAKTPVAVLVALAAIATIETAEVFAASPNTLANDASPVASGVRIKDLVDIEGVRDNDLVGYGLVVGLDGTGDAMRNSPFTEEALVNLLERLGINVSGEAFRTKNVAAVLVTAKLPPFSRTGSRIDVTVSTIGDAKSLRGGTLIMTPLSAPDGEIYAVAQGTVIAGGVGAEGDAASVVVGSPTAGGVPEGATVEREVDFELGSLTEIDLSLRDPDFTTAERIEAAINVAAGRRVARLRDAGTVTVALAAAGRISPARFLSSIENLRVRPDQKARVVVDQRSGTIVLGSDVRVSPVAVTQGNLTIRIAETPVVSQPNPFSDEGDTVVVPRTGVAIDEDLGPGLALIGGEVTLGDLVSGLNALGVGPREMTDILKTIKAAGALHAEFVVQ